MVGAGRVLTASPAMVVRRAEDGPCAAHAAALGHSFAVHRDGAFSSSNGTYL
jgi:hypothetical protein